MAARYGLVIAQSGDTHIAVFLNGVRLHDLRMPKGEFQSETSPPDHWLMPGKNVLTMHVTRAEIEPATVVSATVWDSRTDEKIALLRWPHDFPVEPTTGLRIDRQSRPFMIPEDHKRPLFMDAPAQDVPAEGNEATWAPVLALHDALARGEPNGVFEAHELRAQEYNRFYDVPSSTPAAIRKTVDERVTAPYHLIPIDRDITRFETGADGRVVCVRRLDGLPVIAGKPTVPDVPVVAVERPLLIMNEGRYRILF